MKYHCYDKDYMEIADLLLSNLQEILDRIEDENIADWAFYDFIVECCPDDKEYISEYIEMVMQEKGINCSVSCGCETLAIIFNDYDNVLKISAAPIDHSNEFISYLPEKYQQFFSEHYHIGTLEEKITRREEYTGTLYFFVQEKVDCEEKIGSSNNSYRAGDDYFRSERCLSTIGEYLLPCGTEEEISAELDNFKEACYKAFELTESWGDIDVHNGNWGMRNGVPIIFDPIFQGS